jgi:hypothetical protein
LARSLPAEKFQKSGGIICKLTGPKDEDQPSSSFQRGLIGAVARNVAVKLGVPECPTGGRALTPSWAIVAVPEAAMDEDDGAIARQYYVRIARKILAVQAIPKAVSEKRGADILFGPGVSSLYCGHHPRPHFL